MVKQFFFSLFLFSGVLLFGQQYPTVLNFKGEPQTNGTVHLTFTISQSTFASSYFDLQRSSDSAFNFASVYFYNGAVGGANAQDYFYDDYPPDPSKKYYYKIVFPNGSQSNVIVVDMGSVFGNYKILRHPIEDDGNSKLEFAYKQGQQWVMEIADPRGYFIYKIYNIVQNQVPLNASWFGGSGIYFFRLYPYDGSTVIKGRFVVIKQGS